jgi:hypothetical protein
MKLRVMPMYANIPNTEGQNTLTTMVGFQQRYCKYIGKYLSGDIINIDRMLPNGQTIRQYLMSIRIDDDKRKRLFLDNILPKHRDLASVTIQHLLIKLHFEFPHSSEDGKGLP